jgi:hypothetical protein
MMFKLNPYASRAHELLLELMRAMTHEEYLELRKSIEFCIKIQSIIDSIRTLRHSPTACSIETIGQAKHSPSESAEELGKPKKRVHKSHQSTQEEDEKVILKKLNLSK